MPRYRATFTALTDPFTALGRYEAHDAMMLVASQWFRSHDELLPMLADLRMDLEEIPEEDDNIV